jgi:hypothetical protein
MVTRGNVQRVRLGPQLAVTQVEVLKAEVRQGVELLLPPGMSAVPVGAGVLLFQVNGRCDPDRLARRARIQRLYAPHPHPALRADLSRLRARCLG